MTEDHERIEELLAAHAIGALSGEDRAEAERLLAEHVPGCVTCRAALRGFVELSGDLALAVPPAPAPDVLWPRLRRQVLEPPGTRRRRPFVWGTAAAVAAVMVGLAAWNTSLNSRLSNEIESQRSLSNAITTVADPTSKKIRLDSFNEPAPMEGAYSTREAHLSIVGVGIPQPAPGYVYRVWLLGDQGNRLAADFLPDDGLVILNLPVNLTRYSRLVIDEERAGPHARRPTGTLRWVTDLEPS